MNSDDLVLLSHHIRSGVLLTERDAAKRIWIDERIAERGCLRIDFTGLGPDDLSVDFIKELFRLDLPECRVIWLTPINYSVEVGRLLTGYFAKLKKLRQSGRPDGLGSGRFLLV